MGLILSVACLLIRKQTTTLGVMRNQSGGHLMSCFAIQVMEGDLQGDILERIIAAAYMNENAFNDDDHDDDGYRNLATDVNMDGGDNAENLGNDGRNLGSDGESSFESSSDPEIVNVVPPPIISYSNRPGCSGSKDYRRSMNDTSADTAFASLIMRN